MAVTIPPSEQLEQELRSACSELARRLRAGESCSAETMLGRHPDIAANPDLALELIYTEYVVRVELNQKVSCDDWLTRFPQWSNDLKQLIEVHQQVCGDSTFVPDAKHTSVPGTTAVGVGGSAASEHRRVGNYELLGEVGRGGMGVVYRARQVGLNRQVALKMILSGEYASARERARFRTEAEASARLQHANIVQIYEVGTHDSHPYFSMELVDGGRLDEVLLDTPLSAAQAAQLLQKLASAAHYAHRRGVVHRDLKPSNVLLARCDLAHGVAVGGGNDAVHYEPKIADFGLAKNFIEGQADHTRSGAVVGTPSYMAPEQASGKSTAVGPAIDVYSLGAILYESLTGRTPFLAPTPLDTLRRAQFEEPTPPTRIRSTVPRDLETICLKCLEKDPNRRYATALALADDLGRFLAKEPILARAVSPSERMVKWARRRPALASLIATLAIGFIATSWMWGTAESRRVDAVTALGKAERARGAAQDAQHNAEQARGAAERSLYFHRIAAAQSEWQAFQVGRADQLLEECPPAMRNWEWSYLKTLCHPEQRLLRGHTDVVCCVAYSPDGRYIAAGSGQWGFGRSGEVIIWDAVTGERKCTLRGQNGQISGVAFSPNGQLLATTSARWDNPGPASIKIWNISGEEVLTLAAPGANSVAFSPDGKTLATAGSDGLVAIWNVSDGQLLQNLEGHNKSAYRNVFSVAFSPNGKLVASVGRDGSCRLWKLETGEELKAFSNYGDLRRVAFSPDGRFLAFSVFSDALWIVDLENLGADPMLHRLYTGRIYTFAYSPEGRRMAIASIDGSVRIIEMTRGRDSGRELKQFHAHNGFVAAMAFSPDGQVLATAGMDRAVKLLDARTDRVADEIAPRGGGYFYRMAFMPDGDQLLLASGYNRGSPGFGERAVLGWNLGNSTATTPWRGHSGWLTDIAVRRDGARVATASDDKTARIWDASTGAEILQLAGHSGAVTGVAFRPTDNTVATSSADGTIRTWDATTGEVERELPGYSGRVNTVTYSPNGRWLASGGSDGTVRVWDGDASAESRELLGHTAAVNAVAISHNNEFLASADEDGTIRLWNLVSGTPSHVLRGHNGSVTCICFSNDDRRLASSSVDWTVRLWDVESGNEALTLRANGDLFGLAFSPNGKRLVAARGGILRFWDSEPHDPPAELTAAFERANLTWHEREAKQCETDRLYSAAAFHLGPLIQAQPARATYYTRRGRAMAELGEWERAIGDFERAIESGAGGQSPHEDIAVAYLGAGHLDDYAATCQRLVESLKDSSRLGDINDAVWYGSLTPNACSDPSRLVELGEQIIGKANEAQKQVYTNTLGAALYRAGRFEDSKQVIIESMGMQKGEGIIEDWLFMSLIEARLNHPAEARRWLEKSTNWLAGPPETAPDGSITHRPWFMRVTWHTLIREAESLVSATGQPD